MPVCKSGIDHKILKKTKWKIDVIKVHDDLAMRREDMRKGPIDQLGDAVHPPGGGLTGFAGTVFCHSRTS